MKTTTTQKAFLANSKTKARLIDKLTTELQRAGVLVKQDHLIIALKKKKKKKNFILTPNRQM